MLVILCSFPKLVTMCWTQELFKSEFFLCSWCPQAGGEQPREVCGSGGGRLKRAGGGNAVRTDRGGPHRKTPTGPRRDPDRQGRDDCSGITLG